MPAENQFESVSLGKLFTYEFFLARRPVGFCRRCEGGDTTLIFVHNIDMSSAYSVHFGTLSGVAVFPTSVN